MSRIDNSSAEKFPSNHRAARAGRNSRRFPLVAGQYMLVIAGVLIVAGCRTNHVNTTNPSQAATQPSDPQVSARSLPEAIADGVKYLEQSQNPDGSWGTGTETRGTEIEASIPGSHEGFKFATTSLAVMALKQAGEKSAHDKGLEFLLTHGDVRRATGDLIYNIWAHIYGVQCLAMEMRDNPDPRIRNACLGQIEKMKRYQTYIGGWNYYDFDFKTQQPSMGPTSFGTAAGLVALWEAKRSGIDSPPEFIERTVLRLEEMRLPDGAYLYSQGMQYQPRHPANTPRGSIGRTQSGNDALMVWGSKKMDSEIIRTDLETFFKEHGYIEMGRKRPWPHESWYYTAPYYYYFGHYYASRLLEYVSHADRMKFAGELESVILPHQEPDGSWWDYAMWGYHKPYGTAFAIITLINCRDATSSVRPASAGRANENLASR